MWWKIKSCVCLLLLATGVCAELKIEGDVNIPRDKYSILRVVGTEKDELKGAAIVWDFDNEEKLKITQLPGGTCIVNGPPNSYKFKVRVFTIKDNAISFTEVRGTFTVQGAPDPGPGPGPTPDPGPGPTPPDPTVVPIPLPGFRVIIVEDAKARSKLPKEQQSIIFNKQLRDYLNAKCVIGGDMQTREWRIWDKDESGVGDAKQWQDVMQRVTVGVGPKSVGKYTTLPWIVISTGKSGYEGPLPATVQETLDLVKKYGG